MEEKKRIKLCGDDRCVLCDEGLVEDIAHFLVECKEFEEGRRVLLEEVGNIKGAEGWVEEWRVGDVMERVLLLLGREVGRP